MTELKPGYEETRMHYFTLSEEVKAKAKNATHVRLNYYPDGGVARLRLWGYPPTSITSDTSSSSTHIVEYPSSHQNNHASESIKPLTLPSAEPYKHPELSLCTNGGRGIACSNKHYGVPANLIQPTYGIDMGDGWETARHPERPSILVKDPITHLVDSPLMDWAILKLGMGGASNCPEDGGISRLIIDTKHFKGNYPESVRVEGCFADRFVSDEMVCGTVPDDHDTDDNDDGKNHNNIMNGKVEWFPILPRTRLYADQEHVFERGSEQLVNSNRAVTHVRISIYPDGGISRVRVYGKPALEAIQQ
jgi:allantoicase